MAATAQMAADPARDEIETRALRLAMFSPAPPTPSGIAAYLADLLPLLPEAWCIDVFTDALVLGQATLPGRPGAAPSRCFAHTEFAGRQAAEPYDLIVYQVGNSAERAWMLAYVLAHPGLLVLHDGVLHPARLQAAMGESDLHPYRRALRACRPDAGNALGHLVAAGLGGPALYQTFPMCEDLVRASRLTAMHGEASCDWLRRQVPEAGVVSLAHWRAAAAEHGRRDAWRERLAGRGEVLLGAFGHIGAERRLDRVLRALAELDAASPWRLVVAGRVDARLGLEELARRLGLAARIAWHPDLDDADFVAVMAATDLAVNLRYPPARASSGVLHQLLQLGVPALISDVVHWRDYPDAAVARIPPGPDEAEDAALRTALIAWIDHTGARRAAGTAGRAWSARHLTPEAMRRSYLNAVAEALTC